MGKKRYNLDDNESLAQDSFITFFGNNVANKTLVALDQEVDPITEAIRSLIIERQRRELQSWLSTRSSEVLNDKIKSFSPSEFVVFLKNTDNKQLVRTALKSRELQSNIQEIERSGYAGIIDNPSNNFQPIAWQDEPKPKISQITQIAGQERIKSQIIKHGDKELCTLTEVTKLSQSIDIPVTVNGQEQSKIVTNYRIVDFPTQLPSNDGPMHVSLAVKDENGKNIAKKDAVYFTAHYDKQGKLTEISSPIPLKFTGVGDDAIGYIERNGRVYTLPVTKGKYQEMMVAVGRGQEAQNLVNIVEPVRVVDKVLPNVVHEIHTDTQNPIKARFDKDKKNLISQTEKYLQNPESLQSPKDYRSDLISAVEGGNIGAAIRDLEKLRDAQTGIVYHEIIENGVTPVVIRDARNCTKPPVRSTESFEMQYLNAIRAGIDIAEMEQKPELAKELQRNAVKFIEEFHTNNRNLSQKEIFKNSSKEITAIITTCTAFGVDDAYAKLNTAKDFQNFNDSHGNIATISSVKDPTGKTYTIIESEVGLRGLTEAQKNAYKPIVEDNSIKPSWYTSMPAFKQKLYAKYAPIIIEGNHTLSSQLREAPGMRNAFEKVTSIVDLSQETPVVETLHSSKHAGSLASFPKDAMQEMCNLNAEQAQEWIGKNRRLHCNTFNSEFSLPFTAGLKRDPKIVKQTREAMKKVGGKSTNTAFNGLRIFGSASNYAGASSIIQEISDGLGGNPAFDKVKACLKSSENQSLQMFTNEIDQLKKRDLISDKSARILEQTMDLSLTLKSKGNGFSWNLDPENLNLEISTKLNGLAIEISQLNNKTDETNLHSVYKEEILNMCASGKDRTSVAEQDQTDRAISQKTGITIDQVDAQLIASGHTAYFTGGVSTGGGSIGCYGTKDVSLPNSRKYLGAIQEISSNGNNLQEPGFKLFTTTPKLTPIASVETTKSLNVLKKPELNNPSATTLQGDLDKIAESLHKPYVANSRRVSPKKHHNLFR